MDLRFYTSFSSSLLFILLVSISLVLFSPIGQSDAKPQTWDINTNNRNDPFGKPNFGTSNTDFDSIFKTNRDMFESKDNFGSPTNVDTFETDWQKNRENHERTRKAAVSMFWIITIIIVTFFVIFGLAVLACICVPTCYLAKNWNGRTRGRVYHPTPTGQAAPMTGYPTQQSTTVISPPPYQAQPQIPGQYPPQSGAYPSTSNYPYPYAPTTGPTTMQMPIPPPNSNPNFGPGGSNGTNVYPDLPKN